MVFRIPFIILGLLLGSIQAQDRLKEKIAELQLKVIEDIYKEELINSLREANELLLNKNCTSTSCGASEVELNQEIIELQTTAKNLQVMVHNNNQQLQSMIEDQLHMCQSLLANTKSNSIIERPEATSCAPFGFYTGIEVLHLPGARPFRVFCDGHTIGPGWTLIQRRYDGSEDFNRNWNDYRNGFGNLDKEFFLGLENIYRLTNYQRCELYIYIETFDNEITWARYDNFVIGSEAENYKLISVGYFTGIEDRLTRQVNIEFSSHDRENSLNNYSGYWFFDGFNLGGNKVDDWHTLNSLKALKILIRPKMEYK
ncbi:ficolin-1-like isoform X2 [Drosophila novamexicana]|uniref:ficolin-1-like isoform X2 n=1 Tax=Drosophila novamexicana TaxID=47314 RepID=UPI0011E5CB95|nr:ficolin-1-like isoform X2 [Drosophila novamexicana]